MPPFIIGLFFGLVFIFSLGPAFFSLIQTSVQKGFRSAVFMALGISISDMLYVVLALLGAVSFLEKPIIRMWMAVIGTVILLVYGVYNWFKKPVVAQDDALVIKDLSNLKYTFKGFLLNGLNPFIIVFWLGIISIIAVKYDFSQMEQFYFFMGVLTTILTTDILKAMLAHRLRHLVNRRSLIILNRSVGVILIVFGLQMIFFLYQNYLLE